MSKEAKLAFYVGLPAIVFASITGFDTGDFGKTIGAAFLGGTTGLGTWAFLTAASSLTKSN